MTYPINNDPRYARLYQRDGVPVVPEVHDLDDLCRAMYVERLALADTVRLCLFAVTSDADANDGKVDRLAVAEACRSALDRLRRPVIAARPEPLMVGAKLRALKDHLDDDDGTDRVTPAGSVGIIERADWHGGEVIYSLVFPSTGGGFFLSHAEATDPEWYEVQP
jgi:hypothetical protein